MSLWVSLKAKAWIVSWWTKERIVGSMKWRDAVYDTNVLTVIASESYDDFAKKLQTEIAEACDSRPVVVTATLFAEVTTQTEEGKLIKVTKEQAINIH